MVILEVRRIFEVRKERKRGVKGLCQSQLWRLGESEGW